MSAPYRDFRLHHAALSVSDLAAASRFFAQAFGFEIIERLETLGEDLARMSGYRGLDCALVQMQAPQMPIRLELIRYHLIRYRAPEAPEALPAADPSLWRAGAGHIALQVDDFDAALARAEASGARLLGEVVAWAGGRAAYLGIPGDALLELESRIALGP